MSFRPELKMAWNRVKGELTGAPRQIISSEAIKLVRQDDGHFWLRAELNGHQADLMIDSGATVTAINGKTARKAKLVLDSSGNPVELSTANGVITAQTAQVTTLTIGNFTLDQHEVVVSDSFGEPNVAGMNFLDGFKSWSVTGDVMTLTP
jgi:aspartyl protease family protein